MIGTYFLFLNENPLNQKSNIKLINYAHSNCGEYRRR